MAITDFESWLGCNDLSDYNDVYSLYRSVHDVDEYADLILMFSVIGRIPAVIKADKNVKVTKVTSVQNYRTLIFMNN